jgi:predicted porin
MNKGVLISAACFAFAGAVHAQSNVSMYGLIDAGISYTNNQGGNSNVQALSGQNPGNRLGFKGTEDLGGGLQAVFLLEAGFDVKNGAMTVGNRLFGRQEFVGVSHSTYGSLTMGRQYDALVSFLGPIGAAAMFGTNGNHPMDNDNLGNSFRVNNSIKYMSKPVNGWSFGALYGFSEVPGDAAANRAWSVGTGYKNGPLTFGAAYIRLDNPATNTTGAVGASGGITTSDYPSLANSFVAGPINRHRIAGIGGEYALSNGSKVAAIFTDVAFDLASTSIKFQNLELNGKYFAAPTVWLGGAYTYTSGKIDSTGSKPKYHQLSLMADYVLSKRTDLYVMAIHQKAADGATAARIYAMPASSTDRQSVIRVGMRHTF